MLHPHQISQIKTPIRQREKKYRSCLQNLSKETNQNAGREGGKEP